MGLPNVTAISHRRDLGVSNMVVYEGEDVAGVDASIDTMVSLILSKSQGRPTLRRSEFDPLDFAEQLPNIDIYDFDVPGGSTGEPARTRDAIISFSGSESSAFYGECTGKHLSDIEPSEVSRRAIRFCNIIKSLNGPIVAVVTPGSAHADLSSITVLVSPLTDDTDTINGACIYHVLKRRSQSAA